MRVVLIIAGAGLLGGGLFLGVRKLKESGVLSPATRGEVTIDGNVWTWSTHLDAGQHLAKVKTPSVGGAFPKIQDLGPFDDQPAAKQGAIDWIREDAQQLSA